MCCELQFLTFYRSISDQYRQALREMARRWVTQDCREASGPNPVRLFMAERLIALAAGAAFIVAPACVLLTGIGNPGTYGASVAIALTFLAIPFLALGWLNASKNPWLVGVFVLASWSAMAGALASISPWLALVGGLVLFQVAASSAVAASVIALPGAHTGSVEPEAAVAEDADIETTEIKLGPEGAILTATGKRRSVMHPGGLFINHVHLADRIAFLNALSNVTKQGTGASSATIRVNLAKQAEQQFYKSVAIGLSVDGDTVKLTMRETANPPESGEPDREAAAVARNRFLATVSHELRTPLNSIIGFSDILRRDLFGALANDRQREYVELIHTSGAHLLSVVNTILDVSKLDAGTYSIHREPFDLNGTVQECVSMLEPQAGGKSVTIDLSVAPEIAEADADRRAVRQIVINLLSNAVKFTGEGGTVRISTSRRERGFQIRVADSGIGMSRDELENVGTPFAQADNTYTRECEGTGLGLAVVKGLVDLHGGSLDIASEPGNGTEVTVFIPVDDSRKYKTYNLKDHQGDIAGDRQSAGQGGGKIRENANAIRLAG
jgi:two-component system, cell cycle sensor histidine kinase DivJ